MLPLKCEVCYFMKYLLFRKLNEQLKCIMRAIQNFDYLFHGTMNRPELKQRMREHSNTLPSYFAG